MVLNTLQLTSFLETFNPSEAIGGPFDLEELKKVYVDRASKMNTSNCANGSTNLLSFRENLIYRHFV